MTETTAATKAAPNRLLALWSSVIGKKVVMAVTGAVLILFVIAHMVGNLKIFSGPEEINAYSRFLREVGWPELGLRAAAVDRAQRAVHLRDPAHHRGHAADAHEPAGAAGRVRVQEKCGDHLGRADHALGRRAAGRFHRVSPVSLHRRHGRISAGAI